MKVIASPKFEMTFELPLEAVELMMKCAEHHYDATCRETMAQGGILFTWQRRIKNMQKMKLPKEVTATSRDLDLLLKVMEFRPTLTDRERDEVRRLSEMFMNIFRTANELYSKSYTVFEVRF